MKVRFVLHVLVCAFSVLVVCERSYADCGQNRLTINNTSKYPIQLLLNTTPFTILLPGQSVTNSTLLLGGNTKVYAKPLTNQGQLSNKVKGPHPTAITLDCSKSITYTINFESKHFVKYGCTHSRSATTGGIRKRAGCSAPTTSKPVGDKKGKGLDLSGDWVRVTADKTRCVLALSDSGTFLIVGLLQCTNGYAAEFEGVRLGSRLMLYGIAQNPEEISVPFAGDFGIFANEKDDADILAGKFLFGTKILIKSVFVRLEDVS